MQNDIIIILLFIAICLGTGSWLFIRLVRQLQATTQHQLEANAQEVRVLVVTTQNALAQSQQEVITLRRALASTEGQGYWGICSYNVLLIWQVSVPIVLSFNPNSRRLKESSSTPTCK